MYTIGTFCCEVYNIATVLAAHADDGGIFIAQGNGNNSLAAFVSVIVQIINDFFFECVLILGIDDALLIAAF